MRLFDSFRFRLAVLFHRSEINADMEEELRSHIEHRTDDLERSGLTRVEAERRARIEFGGYERYRQESHHAAGGTFVESLLQDFVFTLRSARKSPLLTGIVIAALSIGIGLNAGVFSLMNLALLQPPIKGDTASFVELYPKYEGWFPDSNAYSSFTAEDFDTIQAQSRTLSKIAAWETANMMLDDQHRKAILLLASCDYFPIFGIDSPLQGRFFLPDECRAGTSAHVAVLSEHGWKGIFNADPKIVGKVIHVGHRPITVIGIMPDLPNQSPGLVLPYTLKPVFHPGNDSFHDADGPWLNMAARLKPGYSRVDAKAELEGILHQRDRLYMERKISKLDRKTSLTLTNGSIIQKPAMQIKGIVVMGLILGPLFLVLLLACTNATMLFLSRSVLRRGETAIRLALGAGRARLVRMLVVESLFTAGLAGLISLFLAYRIPVLLMNIISPKEAQFLPPIQPDWKVFSYLAVLVLVATLVSALAPVRESFRLDLVTALKGREGHATVRSRTTNILIVAQLAMSFVLLAAAILFAKIPHIILSFDPGFEMRQVASVPLDVETPPYTEASAQAFYGSLETRILQIPGVQAVAYQDLDFIGQATPKEIRISGQAKSQGRPSTINTVSAGFFRVFSIPLLRGRSFEPTDISGSGGAAIAIVSEAFAKAFWPNGENPVGKTVVTPDDKRLIVVGVARDTRSEHYGEVDGPRLYTLRDPHSLDGTLYVRFSGDSVPVIRSIEAIVKNLDPDQLVDAPMTLRSKIDEDSKELQPLANVIVIMAGIAMVMAVTGVFGVLSFAINQRKREFGIQMVLGATRQAVFRRVMMRGFRQIALGLFFGAILALPVAFLFKQLVSNSAMRINPFDPVLYAISATVLTVVSLAAMYLPAYRATQVDPMQALRNE